MESDEATANNTREPNIRQRTDPTWKYVSEGVNSNGKNVLICNFCQIAKAGGGINRMKQHLAGQRGSSHACTKVPADVQFLLQGLLKEIAENAKEKKRARSYLNDDSNPIEEISSCPSKTMASGSTCPKDKGKAVEISSFFKTGVQDPKQPTIKACMQSKEKWHDTDMAIAMWLYDACIPFNALNSPLFQIAIDRIASMGHGYKGPSYHAARVDLLRDAKRQVSLLVESLRVHWAEFGCTIMGDGWTDTRQRPLINFLVYCSKGLSFIKSVDASNIFTDAENLCNLFGEIVDIVGPRNVVHMVTDNGANYKAAGRKLSERYPTIKWSPCAVHCINLIMKDIAEMPSVKGVATLASKITVFVYNHKYTLNWLRKRPGWREIVRPGATRFATTFIALKSLHDHKHDLQALVVSDEYKQYLKTPKGKDVKQIVLDERFWQNSFIYVRVMTPMMRLLRICDSDEKPAMGYVYEGMHRARNGIKELFKRKKALYKPYTSIIKKRWDRMLRQNLHAAAYWLNPAFQYDSTNLCKKAEVLKGLLDVVDNQNLYNNDKLMAETTYFQEREGCFSRDMALKQSRIMRPDSWWRTFGYDVPNLQSLAIRILSQTASSSGCERNWSVFERIHTKKRNRLEHQRLNDLVYVHYNLRLKNRSIGKKTIDPVDYESIDETEFWIVEDEHEQELDMNEIENMLEEHPRLGDDSSSILEVNEDNDVILDEMNEDNEGNENNHDDDDDDEWLNHGRNV